MRRTRFLLVALLLTIGCAPRAWRHGHVAAVSPDVFILKERFYPHTEVHVSTSTQFKCGRRTLDIPDLQPGEAVLVEGRYRDDTSIEATKVTLYRTRSECEAERAPSVNEQKDLKRRAIWNLKYRSGSLQLKKGQWLKGGFFNRGQEDRSHAMLLISREQLNAIYFNARAQNDSNVMQHMPASGCYQAHYSMPKHESAPVPEIFAVWASSPGWIGRAAERLNRRYPVRFVWIEDGSKRELVLTVDYCEYASFLANARWFAGERWKEISHDL